jgi:hypothetical protein
MSSSQQQAQLRQLRSKMLWQLRMLFSMDLLAAGAGQAGTILLQEAAVPGKTVHSSRTVAQPLQAVQQL